MPHASKTTQVPEPGTMAALALFGLGGLFAKKKIK
ncbi:PEP-CTERM sorting domain-containing protein [Tolypothrix bouteillei VB521301_2]